MGTYTPVNPDLTGAAFNLVAVAASDVFPNNGERILHVHNGNASATVVTITDQHSIAPPGASAFSGSVVISVAAGADKVIGPFDTARFNDAAGNVTVGYSVTATVTAQVIDAQ